MLNKFGLIRVMVVKHAIVGDYFVANEEIMIGAVRFTKTEDVDNNKKEFLL